MEQKRLYRSSIDKKLCGVCAGLADYINVDPTVIRLLWILFTCITAGTGIIAYIIAAIVIPVRYER